MLLPSKISPICLWTPSSLCFKATTIKWRPNMLWVSWECQNLEPLEVTSGRSSLSLRCQTYLGPTIMPKTVRQDKEVKEGLGTYWIASRAITPKRIGPSHKAKTEVTREGLKDCSISLRVMVSKHNNPNSHKAANREAYQTCCLILWATTKAQEVEPTPWAGSSNDLY